MKILGLNVTIDKKGIGIENSPTPAFATSYASNGSIIDGQRIARNNFTYSAMYRINTDIRGCIREISETSAKSGFKFQKIGADGKPVDVKKDDFIKILNKSEGFETLKDDIIKNLLLFGNAFIRKHNNLRKQPIKFSVLDSRFISIVTDNDLNVLRYTYNPPFVKTAAQTFLPEEILHVMATRDIDNPVFGMTMMETLVLKVFMTEEADLSNYHFFGNDSIPSAIYVLKDGLSSDQTKEQFEIISNMLKGGHNKHKNVVSNAVIDVKPIQQQHKDMNFERQEQTSRESICAAFGVPRTILGYIEDVNHSNGDSQYEKFIENTIRPWEKKIADIFTKLFSAYGEDIEFVIIDEHINDIEQRSKLARDNVLQGIWTRNEAREYIGSDRSDNEFADELTIPTTQQLLDNVAMQKPTETVPAEELPPAA